MTLLDTVVTTREALLSRILSFAGDSILNDAEPTGPPLAGSELAIALKHGANALKAVAIDTEGRQVDYDRLRASEAYAVLRRDSSCLSS